MKYITYLARSIFIGLSIIGLSWTPTTAQAAPPSGDVKITGFDVGFGSQYRVGNWTPVRVTIESDRNLDGSLSVTVPDGDGTPSRVTQNVTLKAGEKKTITLYVRFGRVHSDVTVTVEGTGDEGAAPEVYAEKSYRPDEKGPYYPAVSAENSLLVMVGQKTDLLDQTIQTTDQSTVNHTVSASVSDPATLPHNWIGYEGVDILCLPLSNPTVAEMVFTPEDPRHRAIDQWVRQGGRLVLFGGQVDPELIEKAAKKNHDPARSILPGRPVGIVTIKKVTPLETYINTSLPIPLPAGERRHQIPLLELADPQGTVLVRADNTPLLIQNLHGFGTITFLGVDPSVSPLDKWPDLGRMMAKLLGLPSKVSDASELAGGAVRHLGFTDLSGQMRSALDRFDDVTLIPFGLIVVILLLYTVLIGPTDYFLLKKIGRMSWTWVTFTLVVILFGVGIFWFAHRMKGDQLRLHRIDLVDVDTTNHQVRGTSWANLFSPAGQRYDLAFSSNLPDYLENQDRSVLFSWLGLPGRGLGGMNPRAAEGSVWRKPYDFATNHTAMDGVPLLNWSTKSFTARWSGKWSGNFAFKLQEKDELPVGEVTNPLKNQTLENCLLIYDRWAYQLGTLGPGESITIDGLQGRIRLNTLLTGRKIVMETGSDKVQEQVDSYDIENTDPAYVHKMMMFYKAAGGEAYTGLANRCQPFVDLSNFLGPDRAMLVGRLPVEAAAVTTFTVDGKPLPSDQHTTIFRFILPVEIKK